MEKEFDYLIVGGGMGGISVGALLSRAGKSVCLIEASGTIGGFAHMFGSKGYRFSFGAEYLMGCSKGGPTYNLLKKLDLLDTIKFNEFDIDGFDYVSVEGDTFFIPHGLKKFEKRMIEKFPESREGLVRYFEIIGKLFKEADPRHLLTPSDVIWHPIKHKTIIKYLNYTLHDLFEELELPNHVRVILAGQAGNLAMSPRHASLAMHAGMQAAYCQSAHYPKKGLQFFVDQIASTISKNPSSLVLTDCRAVRFFAEDDKVTTVETTKGTFRAKVVISDIDPHATLEMVHPKKTEEIKKRFTYEYSDSLFKVCIGLKDYDLRAHGISRFNIWHYSVSDLDKLFFQEIKKDNFNHPWVFVSFPSLNADKGELAPKGGASIEALTFVNYSHFKKLYDSDKEAYQALKDTLTGTILDVLEKNYLPDLRKHIDLITVVDPIAIEDTIHSVKGNVYGASLTPENYGMNRVTWKSPYKNLYFVGATSSYPGIVGTSIGALHLFELLHGKDEKAPAKRVFGHLLGVFSRSR